MAVACFEPFSDWLEEKINLPIFEDLPAVESHTFGHFSRETNEAVRLLAEVEAKGNTVLPPPQPPQLMVPDDTQALLQEFESVYGEVELNNGTLTPPQSPTLPSYQNILAQDGNGGQLLITTLQQVVPIRLPPKKESLITLEQMVPVTTIVPDLVREELDVDELVRTCVEDLETSLPVSDAWSVTTSSVDSCSSELSSLAPPSPCTSSNSSFESSDELVEDSEWIPSAQSPAPGNQKTPNSRKRSKPYARAGQEEKRMRKKEQNKNAATRYRQKKKAEIEVILNEEKGLEDKNNELRQKVSDLAREIKYLKGLMRDVFRAKGLIK
ncbi:activating transcription factor of chaperone isoform X2 [Anabrus simplex]|uniref:activating transcription factor of chaperone isoform X2 n=1 Tax=Anabrus simplex TaxID=316456 RepID=UPI0035A366BC